ncbi:MAG: hypothetical protein R3C32_00900 [Chloroflexota bacterium]
MTAARPTASRVRAALGSAPLLVPLLIIMVALSVASSAFLTPTNLQNLLVNASIVAIPSLAMMLCLAMGEFDLSIGSTVSLAGVITCSLIVAGWPTPLAMLAGLVAGGCGAVQRHRGDAPGCHAVHRHAGHPGHRAWHRAHLHRWP